MNDALAKRSAGALSKYNPETGLKTIAVGEAAEKHAARAKDPTKLRHAIRAKLTAQAEFVAWWDGHVEKASGGHATDRRRRSGTAIQAGKNGIPDRSVIERWRRKLADAETFEATYQYALARYIKILELDGDGAHVGQNSGENEWYTPAEYVEAARTVLGDIDLDPATTPAANEIIRASQIFTAKDNGLEQPWHGRVWMNPPYSQPLIEQFCEKFATHSERGDIIGIVLVNNATETTWFQRLASGSMCFCFLKGRIRFWSPRGESATPLQGQVICYTGANTGMFSQAFRSFGFIAERTA